MKLDDITSELLSRAVATYLKTAYPHGEPSEAVRRQADLPPGRRGRELLDDERFERIAGGSDPAAVQRFNLRLGNESYPHMKLGVDRVSGTDDFVLVVDTHDKHFAMMVQQNEQDRYKELLQRNDATKQAIERAWTEAGLPTFENYLRGRLAGLSRRANGQ
ncbi:MAG TPA: hypothetical protein PLP01_15920 [Phycisphaerae bacterium]|nr:hypothetical protein [Phycisphaerae bacterium]HOI56738.1 hypothetical protein [Phycisphaerae bacterium]